MLSSKSMVQNLQYSSGQQQANNNNMTVDEAKSVARDIWDSYRQGGSFKEESLKQMMVQIYSNMKQDFNPTPQDVDGYQKVIDSKGTGIVSIEDIEQHCIRLLCGGEHQQQPYLPPPVMSAQKQNWIDQKKLVAERIFKKYDMGRGYITKNEVSLLIADTYAQIGIQKQPSQGEIDDWMINNDPERTGQVMLYSYTNSITEALMELASELDIN